MGSFRSWQVACARVYLRVDYGSNHTADLLVALLGYFDDGSLLAG